MDIGDSKPKKQVPNMITHRSPNSLFWGVSWCLERISIGMPVSGDGDPGFQAKFLNKAQKKYTLGMLGDHTSGLHFEIVWMQHDIISLKTSRLSQIQAFVAPAANRNEAAQKLVAVFKCMLQ